MMTLVLASKEQFSDAASLLGEYHEAIGVAMRDTPEHIASYLRCNPVQRDPVQHDLVQRDPIAMWIAYDGEHPTGCVILRPLPSMASASECRRLYVRPPFRSKGVASALLDTLEAHAQRVGSRWVYLDSRADLRDALRLYASRGYKPCERYNDDPEPTHFFRKDLTESAREQV